MDQQKIYNIKASLKATQSRRKGMDCKVFEIKLQKLSKLQESKLEQAFLEAKWLYNDVLASEKPFEYKISKTVTVLKFNDETSKCDIPEIRELSLGSQIRQGILTRIFISIRGLATKKKKGLKVGVLGYSKCCNSLPLKQFGTTFRIFEKEISVQGLGKFKAKGLEQLKGSEIANANLVRKASGYFLKVTCFQPKAERERSGEIGLDLGIKDTVVDSNGIKHNWEFDLKKIKKAHKNLSRKKKKSKNSRKAIKKLQKTYEKLNNQKDDAANKFVASLQKYETVVIQDENLRGWHVGRFGRQVQTSILGRIKTKVKTLETSIVVGRFLPTTKICPQCLERNEIPLSQRYFSCNCGFSHPCRDTKAALTILTYGLLEQKTLPVEEVAPGDFYEIFKQLSSKQEAPCFS